MAENITVHRELYFISFSSVSYAQTHVNYPKGCQVHPRVAWNPVWVNMLGTIRSLQCRDSREISLLHLLQVHRNKLTRMKGENAYKLISMQEEKNHNTEGKFRGVIICLLTLHTNLYTPFATQRGVRGGCRSWGLGDDYSGGNILWSLNEPAFISLDRWVELEAERSAIVFPVAS